MTLHMVSLVLLM